MGEQDANPKQFRPRMPGHIVEEAKGLGDVVKRIATFVAVKPCGGCERRAQILNARFPFRRDQ